jgi:hypothetical protein
MQNYLHIVTDHVNRTSVYLYNTILDRVEVCRLFRIPTFCWWHRDSSKYCKPNLFYLLLENLVLLCEHK